ncbi:hypothetical protein CFOL_v3_15664 [Cephalotus follicularis]|uniref:MD-2-related lipid-recognition domain-containing protein n=1 Tax=Cephalotus follicularis TaxID=3775 RepID=A0A1Q3BW16_CEPFO|nr:hypothetical protein CFOL_v3_15664 [Cephalotus follicularis]
MEMINYKHIIVALFLSFCMFFSLIAADNFYYCDGSDGSFVSFDRVVISFDKGQIVTFKMHATTNAEFPFDNAIVKFDVSSSSPALPNLSERHKFCEVTNCPLPVDGPFVITYSPFSPFFNYFETLRGKLTVTITGPNNDVHVCIKSDFAINP